MHPYESVTVHATLFVSLALLAVDPASASSEDPLGRVDVQDTMLANTLGMSVGTEISIGERVQIVSNLTNMQDKKQPFQYIIQIKENGSNTVDAIRWISLELAPNQSLSPAVSWAPKNEGVYTAEIYVWGWEKVGREEFRYEPLSRMTMITITVT